MECEKMTTDRLQWQSMVLLLFLAVALFASGCAVRKDSPAPGCVEYWGFPPMGGCAGKTVIQNLRVEPDLDCLTIEVNNCNGGVLEVRNACSEMLVLGGVEIEASTGPVSLDVQKGESGEYHLVETASNFALYVPQENERIELQGDLGAQEVKISFTKTKELCQ